MLPPEILSRIARGVPDDSDEDRIAIIPLTGVCRYWRESIISTPENWTVISDFRRNAAMLSLERAKSAPLEINLYMGAPGGIRKDPQFLDLLTSRFQNTETLRVTHLWTTEDLFLFSRHPMTNLRSLALEGQWQGDCDRSIDPFESSAYALRYLKLLVVPLYPSFLNIRTLTELELFDYHFNLHLDTLLDFLEGNRSLTSMKLRIRFTEPSLRSSRRQVAIGNRLQSIQITCHDAMDGRALISGIALSKGAELELTCWGGHRDRIGVNDVLSGISTTHLSNLLSPTYIRYHAHPRIIELRGPNGAASFYSHSDSNISFAELPHLSLTNIRRFHLDAREWDRVQPSPGSVAFHHPSAFPALETLALEHEATLSFLSTLLSNPSALPSLKTLAFLKCVLTERFMQGLTRFASNRKKTTSAWLRRVVIIHRDGILPSVASIRKLRKHVPVVDVRDCRRTANGSVKRGLAGRQMVLDGPLCTTSVALHTSTYV